MDIKKKVEGIRGFWGLKITFEDVDEIDMPVNMIYSGDIPEEEQTFIVFDAAMIPDLINELNSLYIEVMKQREG